MKGGNRVSKIRLSDVLLEGGTGPSRNRAADTYLHLERGWEPLPVSTSWASWLPPSSLTPRLLTSFLPLVRKSSWLWPYGNVHLFFRYQEKLKLAGEDSPGHRPAAGRWYRLSRRPAGHPVLRAVGDGAY